MASIPFRRQLQGLFLLALLLVPSVLVGHVHTDNEAASAACASCVVARHTPSTTACVVPALHTFFIEERVAASPAPIAPSEAHYIPTTGRSPPRLASHLS